MLVAIVVVFIFLFSSLQCIHKSVKHDAKPIRSNIESAISTWKTHILQWTFSISRSLFVFLFECFGVFTAFKRVTNIDCISIERIAEKHLNKHTHTLIIQSLTDKPIFETRNGNFDMREREAKTTEKHESGTMKNFVRAEFEVLSSISMTLSFVAHAHTHSTYTHSFGCLSHARTTYRALSI